MSTLDLFSGVVRNLHVGHARDLVREKALGTVNADEQSPGSYSFDSERFDYFACHIDGRLVSGVFRKLLVEEGDTVDVVAEKARDTGFSCVALYVRRTHFLHMEIMHQRGRLAHILASLKFISLMMSLSFLGFSGLVALVADSGEEFILMASLAFVVFLVLTSIMFLWDYYWGGGKERAENSSRIFELLGFNASDSVDLTRRSLLRMHGDPRGECIYDVDGLLPEKN